NDCDSDTKTKKDYITVGASPTAGFSADQTTLKEGETVNFTNKSSGDPDGYEWDFGEGEGTSSQENPSHTYSNPGTYQVSLTATSNNCDSDTEIKGDYITVIGEEKVYAAQEKWGTGRVYLSNLEKSKHDGNLKIGAADLSGIYRSWAWFKMENIPDNAEITSIKLYIDVDEAGAKDHTLYVTDFYRKSTGDDGTTPNTLGKHWEPENISEEIGTGTIYYENDGILSSVGTKGNMNLSSLAVDDFQWKINNRDLGYEYFGIGFLEKGDDDNKAIVDGWDADNPPYIEVTYKIQ
ncbi:MAG: PKD domain-containing protein, partial [Bacteroidota bacterium]